MESSDSSSGKEALGVEDVQAAPKWRNPNVHGEIPECPVGKTWLTRRACSLDGVHGHHLWGIHGNKEDGAFSIVLSGGYEDDQDRGETMTYTGHGGRARKETRMDELQGKTRWHTDGPQVRDQEWVLGNNALKISSETKKPVRVIRGSGAHSQFAPVEGYRYDGLYVVDEAWRAMGTNGFKNCKFRLKRLPGQPPLPRRRTVAHPELEVPASPSPEPIVGAEAGPSGIPFDDNEPAAIRQSARRLLEADDLLYYADILTSDDDEVPAVVAAAVKKRRIRSKQRQMLTPPPSESGMHTPALVSKEARPSLASLSLEPASSRAPVKKAVAALRRPPGVALGKAQTKTNASPPGAGSRTAEPLQLQKSTSSGGDHKPKRRVVKVTMEDCMVRKKEVAHQRSWVDEDLPNHGDGGAVRDERVAGNDTADSTVALGPLSQTPATTSPSAPNVAGSSAIASFHIQGNTVFRGRRLGGLTSEDDVDFFVKKPKIRRPPVILKRPRQALISSDDDSDNVVKKAKITGNHAVSGTSKKGGRELKGGLGVC